MRTKRMRPSTLIASTWIIGVAILIFAGCHSVRPNSATSDPAQSPTDANGGRPVAESCIEGVSHAYQSLIGFTPARILQRSDGSFVASTNSGLLHVTFLHSNCNQDTFHVSYDWLYHNCPLRLSFGGAFSKIILAASESGTLLSTTGDDGRTRSLLLDGRAPVELWAPYPSADRSYKSFFLLLYFPDDSFHVTKEEGVDMLTGEIIYMTNAGLQHKATILGPDVHLRPLPQQTARNGLD